MINWLRYLNIPYKDKGRDFSGVDCYGLIALIYKEEKGIIVPDYTELVYDKDRANIKEREDHLLNSIGIKWLKVDDKLKPFDVLVFNKRCDLKISSHVGLYTGNHRFIHVLEDCPSIIERLDSPLWKTKFYGALRWHK